MTTGKWVRMVVLVLLVQPGAWAAPAAPTEPGETWEQTVQMTAMGMKMPARKSQVCRPLGAGPSEPPMPDDGQCKMTDVVIAGQRVSWKVECKAPAPMSGSGEVVYASDSYSGTMQLSSPQGDVQMNLAGRRLGQACDAGALKKTIAKMEADHAAGQRQMQDSQAAMCVSMAESLNLSVFSGEYASCKDPAHKDLFCKKARTQEGFIAMSKGGEEYAKQVGDFCGFDPQALLPGLCADALQHESLDFLGRFCPDQARSIAQRECAGRKYTSMGGSKYASFCGTYAASMLEADPAGQPAAAEESETGAVKKAKKKLSGLFGR